MASQEVSDEDALQLADAIETIYPEVADMSDSPHGLDAETIGQFAAFCRVGRFSIDEGHALP